MNTAMWANIGRGSPWPLLDQLWAFPNDTEAVEWTLRSASPCDLVALVMGYRKLQVRLRREDPEAIQYADEVLACDSVAGALRVFCLYWYRLPLCYSHTEITGQTRVGIDQPLAHLESARRL
jgi:hypothetical protein